MFPIITFIKNEVELIGQVSSSIAAYVSEDATIIEFGPGTETAFRNKTLPLLKALGKPYKYVAVDLSETYLQQSLDIVKQEFTEVETEAIKTDFIKNCSLVKNFKKPVVWFPGSTIGNLKPEDCLNFLEMMASGLQPNGLFIVGIDGNQDRDSLRKAYYEHPKVRQFLLNILYRIARDSAITNFNPAGFKFQMEWIEKEYCVKQKFVATEDQQLILNNLNITIKMGEEFCFVSSYKYPVEVFQNMAKERGFDCLDYFIDEYQRMTIHVLKAGKK